MQTSLDPSSELFLADVRRIQQRIATASAQVSSGKRLTQASDSPDEVSALLQIRANMARNDRIQSNLSLAGADAGAAGAALASAIKLVDRALTPAAQGANFSLDAVAREGLANEVQAIQEQMVSTSRTAVQGRYLFSGDDESNPAYVLDLTAPNGVVQLSTAAATRRVEDPAGGSFAANKTAAEIFDLRNSDGTVASGNVFAALDGLRLALEANDADATRSSIDTLKQASAQLNTCQAFYGNVQQRVTDATDFAARYKIELEQQLSQKQDADVASAAVELSQANLQLQAAFQMRANVQKKTLFDYL